MSLNPEKFRSRFRFSLLTLLAFVLVLASGGTLWMNWSPLAPAYTIHVDSGVDSGAEALFSPQDRFYLLKKYSYDKASESTRYHLDVRETVSGKPIYTFPDQIRDREFTTVYFSPSERFLFIIRKPDGVVDPFSVPPPADAHRTNVVDLQNGKIVSLHEIFGWECSVASLSKNDLAILRLDNKNSDFKVVTLPALEVLAEFKNREFYPSRISADGESLLGTLNIASSDSRTSSIYSLKSKSQLPLVDIKDYFGEDFCCGEKYVALSVNKDGSKEPLTNLFDVSTGKMVATFAGRAETKRERPGGGQFGGPIQSDANHILLMRHQNTDTWISDFSICCLDAAKPHAVDISGDMMGFINREGCVALRQPFGVFNADQNAWLWRDDTQQIKLPNGYLSASGDWIIYDTTESRAPRIVDARTGRVAHELPSKVWPGTAQSNSQYDVTFCNCHSSFLTRQNAETVEKKEETVFTLWRLNHPLEWYGIFYRPEFWIALVLSGVLFWSARRDRRYSIR